MAEKFNQVCDAIKAQVAKSSALSTVSAKVEEATKVNFEYFVLGLAGIIVLMLFTGILADEIVSAAAFYYPAYASLKALETKSDTTFWVTYWGTSI
jgi:receptor expression-enhancing protein 5/6